MAADKLTNWIIKLVDKVTGPLRNITKHADAATKNMRNLSVNLEKARRGMDRSVTSLRNFGIAAIAFFTAAQGSLAFENAMAKSNTILHRIPAEFEKVTEQVRGLASTIPLAREELSEGLYEVLSAGVPENNAIQFLQDSAKAAVGGSADLASVIQTTTTVLADYNLAFSEAASIQDKMSKAVEVGQMNMNELSDALGNAAPMASMMGMSVDELLGGFAAMARKTGSPAQAATQINAILGSLIKPSHEAIEMSKKLGIAFNATSIKANGGLMNYLDKLMPKIDAFAKRKGISREEIFGQLFGREEALKSIGSLVGALKDDWTNAVNEIGSAAGLVEQNFNVMAGTTLSKTQLMQNAWGNMWDRITNAAAPVITTVIGWLQELFNWISWLISRFPMLSSIVGIILGVALAVWALVTAVGWIVALKNLWIAKMKLGRLLLASNTTAVWAWVTSLWASGTAIGGTVIAGIMSFGSMLAGLVGKLAMATGSTWLFNAALYANPIVWVIAAIIAVGAAIYMLIKYWDDIKAWFGKIAKWFWDHNPFKWMIDLIDRIFPGFKAALKRLWDSIVGWFERLWQKVKLVWDLLKSIFGLSGEAEVTANATVTHENDPSAQPDGPELPAIQPDALAGVPTAGFGTGTGESTAGMDSSGASGKSGAIINVKIDFKPTLNGVKDVDALLDEFFKKFTDQLNDSLIVATR